MVSLRGHRHLVGVRFGVGVRTGGRIWLRVRVRVRARVRVRMRVRVRVRATGSSASAADDGARARPPS